MRKIILLVVFVALAFGAGLAWLYRGRQLTLLADRFRTIQTASHIIKSVTYDGSGTGGLLHADDIVLSLNETAEGVASPHIGTTKQGELALSYGGEIFPFGPSPVDTEALTVRVPEGDQAVIDFRHSAISWPNFFDFNFMTGNSPSWKRNIYQHLTWKKQSGAELEMVWRYEQFFYRQDHWTDALMTRPGATGVIRVRISSRHP